MNSKIKLSIAVVTAFSFFASCNNDKATTSNETADTTTVLKMDTMAHEMPSGEMDNGLMGSMNTMMDKMSAVKMSGDFDLDYANLMVLHHQGALDMAGVEVSKGADEKIKTMANNIITKQTEDIGMLKDIINNYKMSGMKHGEGELAKLVAGMKAGMTNMKMSGNVDKDFAMMMIAHHDDGIKMSDAQLANAMDEKLKQMAKKAKAADKKDIAEFKAWLSANK